MKEPAPALPLGFLDHFQVFRLSVVISSRCLKRTVIWAAWDRNISNMIKNKGELYVDIGPTGNFLKMVKGRTDVLKVPLLIIL